jgi:putative nucleotidyltransferase with HDIG domain
VTTTSVLVLVPLAAAWAVQTFSPAHALPLSIATGMLVSVGVTWLATTLWAHTPRAGERVFGDVTLLGLWRYERANRQIAQLEAVMADHETITGDEARRVMMRLADALERRDLRTHGHSRRVARHSAAIAREMGLDPEAIARIRFAAAMHDIGKLRVPAEILFKPGKLTNEEFDVIKQHPVDSAEMVRVINDPELVAIIRGHHERWDGCGYPDNLSGAEIPLGSRIIAVADTFDALVSDRPYREATAHEKARAIIAEGSGEQFDPQVADAFRQYYRGGNWHVAWGAVSALPPRIASLIGDLLRGGLPAASAAPAIAALAIAATGVASVGGLPGAADFDRSTTPGGGAVAVVVAGSGGRTVKLDNGNVITLPRGVKLNDRGIAVDSSGKPVDLTKTGDANAPTTGPASEAAGNKDSGGDAVSGESSSAGGNSGGDGKSDSPGNVGDTVKDTTKKTTDTVGDTTKGVGETVDKVGDAVKDVGAGEVTDTAGDATKSVGGVVKDTGENVKKTGDAVGGALSGALGAKK